MKQCQEGSGRARLLVVPSRVRKTNGLSLREEHYGFSRAWVTGLVKATRGSAKSPVMP
jgi:hypothetical protein